jgi:guanylate kinase
VTDGLAGRTFPLVLAAPSGAGKTTIARALRERRGDVVFSVSATTRPRGPASATAWTTTSWTTPSSAA